MSSDPVRTIHFGEYEKHLAACLKLPDHQVDSIVALLSSDPRSTFESLAIDLAYARRKDVRRFRNTYEADLLMISCLDLNPNDQERLKALRRSGNQSKFQHIAKQLDLQDQGRLRPCLKIMRFSVLRRTHPNWVPAVIQLLFAVIALANLGLYYHLSRRPHPTVEQIMPTKLVVRIVPYHDISPTTHWNHEYEYDGSEFLLNSTTVELPSLVKSPKEKQTVPNLVMIIRNIGSHGTGTGCLSGKLTRSDSTAPEPISERFDLEQDESIGFLLLASSDDTITWYESPIFDRKCDGRDPQREGAVRVQSYPYSRRS